MQRVEPNHHASHPGFSGFQGFTRAIAFLFGRDTAAELAIRLAEVQSGDHVVDIGCGPGVAADRAAQLGARVVGVDPAPVMLNVAKMRFRRKNLEWRTGTAEAIPVEDGWADAIWSLATVHHWHDLETGLGEVHRALAPDGRLLALERKIADPHAEGTAGHGWTRDQADFFAEICGAHGFTDATVAVHPGETELISVTARRQA